MPILRISAQEIHGIVVDNDRRRAMEMLTRDAGAILALVGVAMEEHDIMPVVCPPGKVNITPRYWERNHAEHILEVLPSGEEALYHMMPMNRTFAPAPYEHVAQEIVAQDLTTTQSVRIPDEGRVIPIVGPIAGDPRIRIHEMIMYTSILPS